TEIAPTVVHPLLQVTIRDLRRIARLRLRGEHEPARELAGRRALVTGSTSGIGKAIALELASAGAYVIVHGRRLSAAAAVEKEIANEDVRGHFLLADLRSPDECRRLVEEAWRLWGGIDIWINNAGADTLTGETGRWPFERKLEELLAVDVTA